jgi:hypothetical protein
MFHLLPTRRTKAHIIKRKQGQYVQFLLKKPLASRHFANGIIIGLPGREKFLPYNGREQKTAIRRL